MKLYIDRKYKKSGYTIGHMYVDGKYVCDTLEDSDRGLNKDMPLEYIKKVKVYGETAIPTGEYEVTLSYSPKFKRIMPIVMDVPGWSGVRIHAANKATQLAGCIAPGLNRIKGMVVESTKYYYKLMDEYITPAIKNKEKIMLTIK